MPIAGSKLNPKVTYASHHEPLIQITRGQAVQKRSRPKHVPISKYRTPTMEVCKTNYGSPQNQLWKSTKPIMEVHKANYGSLCNQVWPDCDGPLGVAGRLWLGIMLFQSSTIRPSRLPECNINAPIELPRGKISLRCHAWPAWGAGQPALPCTVSLGRRPACAAMRGQPGMQVSTRCRARSAWDAGRPALPCTVSLGCSLTTVPARDFPGARAA